MLKQSLVAALLGVHLVLGLGTLRALSPTYDEPVHLAAGYSYLKTGDYRLNAFDHPPFTEIWAALPLLFLRPSLPLQHPYWQEIWRYQYPFSDLFLYKNIVDPEKMLHLGRAMILVLSLCLGGAIYWWSRQLFGEGSGLVSLFLWSFSPFFIAHGTLVTTDMGLTLFYFTSFYFLWCWWKRSGSNDRNDTIVLVLFALSTGFALASKYSAVVLPVAAVGMLLYLRLCTNFKIKGLPGRALMVAVLILLILLVLYQFNSLFVYYWLGLKKVLGGLSSGRSSFLMGEYSTSGWKHYFPVVFALKTPLPLLIFLLTALFIRRQFTRETVLFLLFPAALYFALSCFSKVQIGHRHILPVYPFLIVWVSGLYPRIRNRAVKAGAAVLLSWLAFGTIRNHPWHISYFNELIGSPDHAHNYLTDSNLDWGQGLKSLGSYLRSERVSGVYFSYFGSGDPHYYGIRYSPVGFIDNLTPQGHRQGDPVDYGREPRILFAVSATNLEATYYADKKVFSWLKDIPPEKIIAHSIFVYDMSRYPRAYEKLRVLVNPDEKART